MINILVLTHKDMRSNPINLILTGIAVADMMVMVEYIPFAIHMYLLDESYRSLEEQVILKSWLFRKTSNLFSIPTSGDSSYFSMSTSL